MAKYTGWVARGFPGSPFWMFNGVAMAPGAEGAGLGGFSDPDYQAGDYLRRLAAAYRQPQQRGPSPFAYQPPKLKKKGSST